MSNCGFVNIRPALTFRPLSPFLAMLIASACKRLEGPEEMAPTSVVQPAHHRARRGAGGPRRASTALSDPSPARP